MGGCARLPKLQSTNKVEKRKYTVNNVKQMHVFFYVCWFIVAAFLCLCASAVGNNCSLATDETSMGSNESVSSQSSTASASEVSTEKTEHATLCSSLSSGSSSRWVFVFAFVSNQYSTVSPLKMQVFLYNFQIVKSQTRRIDYTIVYIIVHDVV